MLQIESEAFGRAASVRSPPRNRSSRAPFNRSLLPQRPYDSHTTSHSIRLAITLLSGSVQSKLRANEQKGAKQRHLISAKVDRCTTCYTLPWRLKLGILKLTSCNQIIAGITPSLSGCTALSSPSRQCIVREFVFKLTQSRVLGATLEIKKRVL